MYQECNFHHLTTATIVADGGHWYHGSSDSMAGGCTRLAIDEDRELADIFLHLSCIYISLFIYIYIHR